MSDIVGKVIKPTTEFLEDLARKLPEALGTGHHRVGQRIHTAADDFDHAEDDVAAAARRTHGGPGGGGPPGEPGSGAGAGPGPADASGGTGGPGDAGGHRGTGGPGGDGNGDGNDDDPNGTGGTGDPNGTGGADDPNGTPPAGDGRKPVAALPSGAKSDLDDRLTDLEHRHPGDFADLEKDPDKSGKVSPDSQDEARVGLDMRDRGTLPPDIQRPAERGHGEFYSPSTGRYYDIKGVHSDWPPLNNVRDKSLPFKGAYDPANNGKFEAKLHDQIAAKNRVVVIDVRNANQAAIDDLEAMVKRNGWESDVVWYP